MGDWKRSNRCRGKRRYRDHQEAVRAIQRFATHSTRDVKPNRAYPCSVCNGFHLTSKAAY